MLFIASEINIPINIHEIQLVPGRVQKQYLS